MRRFLPEATRAAILAEYAQPNGSPALIARRWGVHRKYVTELARRRGVKSPRPQYRASNIWRHGGMQ